MPHLTLEYTKNLTGFDETKALLRLNKALAGSGQFDEVDIKSRAIPLEAFVVGAAPDNRAFVHAKLSLSSGRSIGIKSMLSSLLLQELRQLFPRSPRHHLQLCVELMDIERETYAKDMIEPAL